MRDGGVADAADTVAVEVAKTAWGEGDAARCPGRTCGWANVIGKPLNWHKQQLYLKRFLSQQKLSLQANLGLVASEIFFQPVASLTKEETSDAARFSYNCFNSFPKVPFWDHPKFK